MNKKDTDFLHKIGTNIAKKRAERGYSQDAFALEADISRRTIFRLESGDINPKVLTLKKVAKALKVKLSDLIS